MSGGLSGSTTTKIKQPEYIVQGGKDALQMAREIGQIGYLPYYGPTVAAFAPGQEAAMANTNAAAQAFGLLAPSGTGMPEPMNVGGMRGYSEMPIFEMAMEALRQQQAERFNRLQTFGNGQFAPLQQDSGPRPLFGYR
jgi:hypothetical protein